MAFGRRNEITVSDNRKNTRDFTADTIAALQNKHALLKRYGGDADTITDIETKLASLGAPIGEDVVGTPADGETGELAQVVDGAGVTHTGTIPTSVNDTEASSVESKTEDPGLEKAVPPAPAQVNAAIKPSTSTPAKKAVATKKPIRQSGAPASGKQGDDDERTSGAPSTSTAD